MENPFQRLGCYLVEIMDVSTKQYWMVNPPTSSVLSSLRVEKVEGHTEEGRETWRGILGRWHIGVTPYQREVARLRLVWREDFLPPTQ
jgi:hypothetical protein